MACLVQQWKDVGTKEEGRSPLLVPELRDDQGLDVLTTEPQ